MTTTAIIVLSLLILAVLAGLGWLAWVVDQNRGLHGDGHGDEWHPKNRWEDEE